MRTGSGEAGNGWTPNGHCTIFVCDIIGFGKRADHVQAHLRTVLYGTLETCLEASGIPLSACYREDRGDGVIVVPPPSYDPSRLVHPLPDHLRGELRRYNELAAESAQMRLRVALHSGSLESDANGIVGTTVNHVNRLLDAPSFKEALAEVSADLGVLASAEFYDAVIRYGRGAVDPTEFRPIDVRLKETETTAWLCLRPAQPPGQVATTTSAQVEPIPGGGVSSSAAGLTARYRSKREESGALPGLFELVEGLMDIPLLTTAEGREQIVGSLRNEIAIRIPRRAQAHLDTHSIVRTCLEFPNGLEEFLAVVHAYVGDSTQMQALEDTVARLAGGDR